MPRDNALNVKSAVESAGKPAVPGFHKEYTQNLPVLLVILDPAMCRAISAELRKVGYRTLETCSAEEGVRLAATSTPSVIIADLPLPEVSGVDFSTRINASGQTPIIFLATNPDESTLGSALKAGAFVCLGKPIDPQQLVPIVYAAIHRSADLRASRGLERHTEEQVRTINIVIGLMMERFHMSHTNAYKRLRQYARSQRLKIPDLARTILEASDRANDLLAALAEISLRAPSPGTGAGDDTSA